MRHVRLALFVLWAVSSVFGQCSKLNNGYTLSGIATLGCGTTQSGSITIPFPQSLPTATQGIAYSATITVTGGIPPYTYSVPPGSLPTGIPTPSSNSTGAVFAGVPSQSGTFPFTLTACDTLNACAAASFTLGVSPVPVSIPAQNCPTGAQNIAYAGCNIVAQNGITPFTWSVSSGTLPTGLSLSTVSNNASITGTPTGSGASSFTLKVTDSTNPTPGTATINLSITINASGACGFPLFPCARTDANSLNITSMGTVPPNAGPNTCSAGAAGTIQSCGNSTGINTIITDPAFNNVKILRITDIGDYGACIPPMAGPGGDAGRNVFDPTDTYFLVECGGGTAIIKWLNTSTFQLNTTNDPQGRVLTSTGTVFTTLKATRASYVTQGKFYTWSGSTVNTFTVTSGVAGSSSVVTDFKYGIPCWANACAAWASGTYQPGTSLIPTSSNNPANHIFQLINFAACTTGASEPTWQYAPVTVGKPTLTQFVIADGTCNWADMSLPNHVVIGTGDPASDDLHFSIQMGNGPGGQDGAGYCYNEVYNSSANTFSLYNICTGNVYNSTCTGGTGFACTGGTWGINYIGNVYNTNPNVKGQSARNIHNDQLSQTANYLLLSFNNCALTTPAGTPVQCPYTGLNVYYWFVGTSTMLDACTTFLACTIGHAFEGANVEIFGANASRPYTEPAAYLSFNFNSKTFGKYWDMSLGPTCSPNPCFTGTPPTKVVHWDQHGSWVDNFGSDTVPLCLQTYGLDGGGDNTIWPPRFPWLGEVVCFDTNGTDTSTVWRQAFAYDTQTNPNFNDSYQIGSFSNSGKFWEMSSDWYCTLGNKAGLATTLCGFPYQQNHAYSTLNEELGPVLVYGGQVGRIYKVTTTGTSAGPVASSSWCNTAGCTVTSGTATFTFAGINDSQVGVFLVKLQ